MAPAELCQPRCSSQAFRMLESFSELADAAGDHSFPAMIQLRNLTSHPVIAHNFQPDQQVGETGWFLEIPTRTQQVGSLDIVLVARCCQNDRPDSAALR